MNRWCFYERFLLTPSAKSDEVQKRWDFLLFESFLQDDFESLIAVVISTNDLISSVEVGNQHGLIVTTGQGVDIGKALFCAPAMLLFDQMLCNALTPISRDNTTNPAFKIVIAYLITNLVSNHLFCVIRKTTQYLMLSMKVFCE